MADAHRTDEQYLREVKLDRGQRARAELISGEVNENPIMAAFEIIYLRDQLQRSAELLRAFRHAYEPNGRFPLIDEIEDYMEKACG